MQYSFFFPSLNNPIKNILRINLLLTSVRMYIYKNAKNQFEVTICRELMDRQQAKPF